MYSDAFPAVSPYAAGTLKFLFFEGKDKQTKAIPKKTAGKASKKTEARQSTVLYGLFLPGTNNFPWFMAAKVTTVMAKCASEYGIDHDSHPADNFKA